MIFSINIKNQWTETFLMEVEDGETVWSLKQRIQDALGIPVENQELVHEDVVLKNFRTMNDYHIRVGSEIEVNFRKVGN